MKSLSCSYYVDGKLITSSGACNADNSDIKSGEKFWFELKAGDAENGYTLTLIED